MPSSPRRDMNLRKCPRAAHGHCALALAVALAAMAASMRHFCIARTALVGRGCADRAQGMPGLAEAQAAVPLPHHHLLRRHPPRRPPAPTRRLCPRRPRRQRSPLPRQEQPSRVSCLSVPSNTTRPVQLRRRLWLLLLLLLPWLHSTDMAVSAEASASMRPPCPTSPSMTTTPRRCRPPFPSSSPPSQLSPDFLRPRRLQPCARPVSKTSCALPRHRRRSQASHCRQVGRRHCKTPRRTPTEPRASRTAPFLRSMVHPQAPTAPMGMLH